MRGKHISTPIDELVSRAKGLAAKGVKELILIAQDLTYYGLDLYKKRELARLVDQLSAVDGIDWIRLHYAFPSGFPMDVLDVMRDRKNVCNYLDIPLQHASTRMLKAMRRGITREKTTELIHNIRERVPGIAVRTTLISGYPGESEADHAEMLEWVEQMRFDRLGVFTYSHEEDTHAHNFEDDVPPELKQHRAEEIMELQSGISHEINLSKVGSSQKVMIDRVEGGPDGDYIGRTEADSPEVDNEVIIPKSTGYARIGDFAQVKITDAGPYDLYGELVG